MGALYSNMDWWWLASIFSREQGIGSLHSKSWFSALSASSLTRATKIKKRLSIDIILKFTSYWGPG